MISPDNQNRDIIYTGAVRNRAAFVVPTPSARKGLGGKTYISTLLSRRRYMPRAARPEHKDTACHSDQAEIQGHGAAYAKN